MLRTLPRPGIITSQRGIQRPLWPFAVNRDSPQAEGLVAWWPFMPAGGKQLLDLIGGLTATATSTPADGDWIAADFSSFAFNFQGANEFATADVSLGTNPALTFAVWANPTAGLNQTGCLLGWRESGGPFQQYVFQIANGTWDGGSPSAGQRLMAYTYPGPSNAYTNATVADGNWHHLAVVFLPGGSPQISLYVDGQLVAQTVENSNAFGISDAIPFTIGGANTVEYFRGSLLEARAYLRALSADEIAALYDPATRWELYYPLRQRVWGFGPVPPAPVPKQLSLPGSVGTALPLPGIIGTSIALVGSL